LVECAIGFLNRKNVFRQWILWGLSIILHPQRADILVRPYHII
jgi:hypothetical protein